VILANHNVTSVQNDKKSWLSSLSLTSIFCHFTHLWHCGWSMSHDIDTPMSPKCYPCLTPFLNFFSYHSSIVGGGFWSEIIPQHHFLLSFYLNTWLSTYICFFFSFFLLLFIGLVWCCVCSSFYATLCLFIVLCGVCWCLYLSTVFLGSCWYIHFNSLQLWWSLNVNVVNTKAWLFWLLLFCHFCLHMLLYAINLSVAILFVDSRCSTFSNL